MDLRKPGYGLYLAFELKPRGSQSSLCPACRHCNPSGAPQGVPSLSTGICPFPARCVPEDLLICSELWNLPAADSGFVKTATAVNVDEGQKRKKGMIRSPACAPGGWGQAWVWGGSPEVAECSLPNALDHESSRVLPVQTDARKATSESDANTTITSNE